MTEGWSILHSPAAMLLIVALLAFVVVRSLQRRRSLQRELRRAGERYRIIVEQSGDAIWLAAHGRLEFVNAACARLLGARRTTELIGRPLTELLPEAPPPGAPPPRDGPQAPLHETRARRLDGGQVEVEVSLVTMPEHDGSAVQGVMRDITERKRAEGELRNSQAALLQAQQLARLGYATLDVAAGVWTVSPSLAVLLGLPPKHPLEYGVGWSIVHPEDRAALAMHLERDVLADGQRYDREFRIVRPDDDQTRWLHAVGRVERDAGGRAVRLFATLQDITERKQALLALEQSREELRRLSASVTWAREAERQRVARELHDELGQRLSVLKLDLAALQAVPGSADDERRARVHTLAGGLDEALAATRRIAADLRPAMLDDLGLSAALEWLAQGWSRRTGIVIAVDGDPVDDQISAEGAITVYRIVQEALTNVTRHAQARHAHIELRRRDAELVLVVEDDGRGLAPGDIDKRESSGLAGIRERARIMGGMAAVDNGSDGGVRLEVRLPLERVDRTRAALEAAP